MPVFNELIRVTKPGGYILIHTDMETPERDADFISWWYVLPPDHCSYYKHHTFEVMLRDTPHTIVYKDSRKIVVRK